MDGEMYLVFDDEKETEEDFELCVAREALNLLSVWRPLGVNRIWRKGKISKPMVMVGVQEDSTDT